MLVATKQKTVKRTRGVFRKLAVRKLLAHKQLQSAPKKVTAKTSFDGSVYLQNQAERNRKGRAAAGKRHANTARLALASANHAKPGGFKTKLVSNRSIKRLQNQIRRVNKFKKTRKQAARIRRRLKRVKALKVLRAQKRARNKKLSLLRNAKQIKRAKLPGQVIKQMRIAFRNFTPPKPKQLLSVTRNATNSIHAHDLSKSYASSYKAATHVRL